MTNIPEINNGAISKVAHYEVYHKMYNDQKQIFSKSPAGQFYEYFVKVRNGLEYVERKNKDSHWLHEYHDLRDVIANEACEYALLKDNPNPGLPYILKLVNYVHLKVHKESFKEYIKDQMHRQY